MDGPFSQQTRGTFLMAKNLLVSEALVDTIIRCLRAGSYITDDASITDLKGVEVDSTEAERDALATSLSYGGLGGGTTLSSTGDINCFVDSDNSNPSSPYTNYFRIVKSQQTVPVLSAARELFTVGSQTDPDGSIWCRIGPQTSIVQSGDDVSANLVLGAGYVGGSAQAYAWFSGSQAALGVLSLGDIILGTGVNKDIQLGAGADITMTMSGKPSSEALLWQYDTSYDVYRLLINNGSAERTIFTSTNFVDGYNNPQMRFCVGGIPGTQHLDPSNVLIGRTLDGTYTTEATHMFVSPNVGDVRCGFYAVNRTTTGNAQNYTHLHNFHCDLDIDALPPSGYEELRLFSVSAYAGINREVFFSVGYDGQCYATRGFVNGQADVCEYFEVATEAGDFPPGTVVEVNSHGLLQPASSYASAAVIGVVTTDPALTLGKQLLDNGIPQSKLVKVALTGTTPVRCNLNGGQINPGDLLVSDSNGEARKYPSPYPPTGVVIGKAIGQLTEPHGSIRMLIMNR